MGCAYTVFDTAIGRCAIAWSEHGVLHVQLAETREIETRRKVLRQHPDARETLEPPREIARAAEGIAALLRGDAADFTGVPLDMTGQPAFNRRVYEVAREIPQGNTRTHAQIAATLGASGALNAVGHALTRNPYTLIVPCHRARVAAGDISGRPAFGGVTTHYRLLSIEGALARNGPTLLDVLLPLARPPLRT